MRRAWIEITTCKEAYRVFSVALHAEGVDRNKAFALAVTYRSIVALHAEGVDRNCQDAEDFFEFVGRPPCGGRG